MINSLRRRSAREAINAGPVAIDLIAVYIGELIRTFAAARFNGNADVMALRKVGIDRRAIKDGAARAGRRHFDSRFIAGAPATFAAEELVGIDVIVVNAFAHARLATGFRM